MNLKIQHCLLLLCFFFISCKEESHLLPNINQELRDSSTIYMANELQKINQSIPWERHNYRNGERARMFKQLSKTKSNREAVTLDLRSEYELLLSGETREAIKGFHRIDSIARSMGIPENQAVYRMTSKFRAIANMRLAEQENCLNNHNEESCLLPFEEKSIHLMTEGSSESIKEYTKLLNQADDLNFRWVLNIAYATLGLYPDSVPPQFLIPLNRNEEQLLVGGKFRNISSHLGVDDNRLSGGVVVEDFDNDLDLDIMVSSWNLNDNVFYYENDGQGGFVNKYKEAKLEGITGGLNMTHGDYNNDGFADVFITRGAWLEIGLYPNSLLRNNGNGTFTDVTKEAGIYSLHPTQTSVWADFNNDGWLDIFVGNESYQRLNHPCELWLNDGKGNFQNVASQVSSDIIAFVKGVCTSDYDNDGDQDVFLSNMAGDNVLLQNEKTDGYPGFKFVDISQSAGIQKPSQSFPCWFFDINNDGWDDLFVSSFPHSAYGNFAAEYAKEMMGLENNIEKPKVYINNKKGGFLDKTEKYNLNTTCYSMGSGFGDINNDGFLDFYLGTGEPDFAALVPNRMFLNIQGEEFSEVTAQGGFGHIQKGHSISFADINNDGHEDVYAVMGGAYEGDIFYNALFLNPGNGNSWLKLQLEGTKSNRAGYGSKVELKLKSKNGNRSIFRTISSGSSFGENPNLLHFGIRRGEEILNLEIKWPSGLKQSFSDIQRERIYRITEGDAAIKIVAKGPIELNLNKSPNHNH